MGQTCLGCTHACVHVLLFILMDEYPSFSWQENYCRKAPYWQGIHFMIIPQFWNFRDQLNSLQLIVHTSKKECLLLLLTRLSNCGCQNTAKYLRNHENPDKLLTQSSDICWVSGPEIILRPSMDTNLEAQIPQESQEVEQRLDFVTKRQIGPTQGIYRTKT